MQGPGFAAEEAGWLQRMVNVFNARSPALLLFLGARECARLAAARGRYLSRRVGMSLSHD